VRFIDLDDSFAGPAPLAMINWSQRSGGAESAYKAYERSWTPSLRGTDWPAFELAAMVLTAWLGWNRLKTNVTRGEVFGLLDLAAEQTRHRLRQAVHRL
jgi:hypothetical protein